MLAIILQVELSIFLIIDILNSFNIEVEDDKILDSLMKLKGKKVYLLKIPDYENKYQVLKDYNEVN